MASAAARRKSVLREMGLGPVWRLRGNEIVDEAEPTPAEPVAIAPPPVQSPPAAQAVATTPVPPAAPRPARPQVIPQSGAESRRAAPVSAAQPSAPPAPVVDPGRDNRIATLEWDALEDDIRACGACVLCQRRKQAVPGVGDRKAELMLVGEGPGAEEDQRGEPFVGQAGKLLDNMLAAIGMKRGEGVYIANAVKCRPPHNRTPEAGEIAACLPYLERQIQLVQPRLLVALGRPAAQALLQTEVGIGAARGKRFQRGEVPVVVTYHPAYLLRNPQDKAKAWEDLCFARRTLAELRRG